MKTETIHYNDGQETLIGELIFDEKKSNPQAAVILFHAFEGRSSFVHNYALQIANQGYTVFVADIYGDAKTSLTIEGCFDLVKPFLADRSLVRRRAVLALEILKTQKNIDLKKIGAAGFCFGGMCVLELARSGAEFKCGITLHGFLAKSQLETHSIKPNLLILHGYQDPQVPPENLATFSEEMEKATVHDWTFVFFGKGKHSFTDPKTGTFNPSKEKEMGREYNKTIADRSFTYLCDFLAEQL